MDFPDQKSLRGFRSKAQSRWAFATDQWWADEYEKNTNYSVIPDRVNEDIQENIGDWGMTLTDEGHIFLKYWNDAIKRLQDASTIKEFEEASRRIFKSAKIWENDKNLKDKKIVSFLLGQYTELLRILEKWKKEAADKISPKLKDKWEVFLDRHGNPEDDVWEPWNKQIKSNKEMNDPEAYKMGLECSKELSNKIVDWINFNLNNKSQYSFIKGIIKGSKENINITNDDTAALVVNENALVRKASRQIGVDFNILENLWEECVKEQTKINTEGIKSKQFWGKVVERFKTKIRNIDVMEAKRIMDQRKQLRKSIDEFVTNIARGEYDAAQSSVPKMLSKQLGTMINRKKEDYLKNLGSSIKDRAKEA